jgi:hypothetical protein
MLETLVGFAGIAVLVSVTPGPATALVVRRAARHGRREAMLTTLGNSTGILTWALASVLGISALVAASEAAFWVLKVAGAVVLVWLGVRALLARGAARAGRAEPPPIAGYLTCSIDHDAEQARGAARAVIAFNSTVKTYEVVHRLHGFEPHVERIRAAWRAGDFAGMAAAVPDEMVDAIALAGRSAEARERFRERWAGVYERTLLWPPAFRGREAIEAAVYCFADPGSG